MDRHALIALRETAGVRAEELARRMGVSRATLQMIECGRRRLSSARWERAKQAVAEFERERLETLQARYDVVVLPTNVPKRKEDAVRCGK